MAAKNEFHHESIQDHQTISQYLKALMEGFEKKKILFDSSDRQISLEPNNLIELEIKAKKKNGKNKISLKFFWKDAPADLQQENSFEIH